MSAKDPHNEPDSLEAFFKKRLWEAELAPPDRAWEAVQEELNRLEKEKRRRRFIWFFLSGLLLVGGLAGVLGIYETSIKKNEIPSTKAESTNKKEILNSKIENVEGKKLTEGKISRSGKEENLNFTTENSKEKILNTKSEHNNESRAIEKEITRIQLGAFKNHVDKKVFEKIPFAVIEEKGDDGYTRYFAESSGNANADLEIIHHAGFSGAFVKNSEAGRHTGNNTTPALLAENRSSSDHKKPENNFVSHDNILSGNDENASKNSAIGASATINEKEQTPVGHTATTNAKDSKQKTAETIATISEPEQNNNPKNNPEEKNSIVNNTASNANTVQPENPQFNPPAGEIKSDSTNSVATTGPAKIDSLPKNETKKDSTAQATAARDSSKQVPFVPEWSILLAGGPTFILSHSQSNLFPASNEKQPNTFNAEAHVQWRPLKLFSFSAGLTFNTFTAKQDDTLVKFDKHQQQDFLFYSSYGAMAVPMSTMMMGFNPNFPIDTFRCGYAYTATLQTLNIPLQANLHFLNTSRVSVYASAGVNATYALSQHSHLTLIKENFNTDILYNKVTVNRFNTMLTLGLGCDIKLYKRLYFTLAPSYRYALNNQSATSGITFKPSYFSANGGFRIKF